MFKVIAVYRTPATDEAKAKFDAHFRDVHGPLCLRVPGLQEMRVNKITGGPLGASNLHQIVTMVFPTESAWQAAMKSPEMIETGKDAMKFAGDLVSVHFATDTTHTPEGK